MVNRRPESGTAAVARSVPRPPSPGAVCSADVQMLTIQYRHKSRHSQRIGLPSSLLFWALGVEMFSKPREILLSPPVERILSFLLVFPRGYPYKGFAVDGLSHFQRACIRCTLEKRC